MMMGSSNENSPEEVAASGLFFSDACIEKRFEAIDKRK